MYKGKFDQKKKGGTTDIHELVSQRNQPAAPDIPELKPRKSRPVPAGDQRKPLTPDDQAPQKAAPQQKKTAPAPQSKKAAPQKSAPETAPKKKGPRLGGVIFYTLYFLFILVFFLGVFGGMLYLRNWLVDFEAAQPTVKSEQVFTQLFTSPDWGALYQSAGAKDSPFEGKDAYVAYMQEKVGASKLTYLETSAGLSSNKKFLVRLGEEKVASFTLVDKNKVGDISLDNLKDVQKLPDWQLGSVEVFFERPNSYRIVKSADHTAFVNDVALDDEFTIQKATTRAEEYLPAGVTSASTIVQEVTGFMNQPTVTVKNKKGEDVEVTYDEETRTFTARTESNTASDPGHEDLVRKAAETLSLFMLEKATRADVAKYFDATGNAYKNLPTEKLWVQKNSGHEFVDEKVSEFASYSDSIFSARVTMTISVTRTDGTPKEFPFDMTFFFHKMDNGSWKVYESTNKDVSAPQGQVRLTFMDGENKLVSEFFETDAKSIVTPLLPVPEGKVFSGWATRDVAADGSITMNLMFQPDEHGKVALAEGTSLLPMTLHAVFENAGEAAAQAPETAPTEEVSE